jgi:hypothetical protein
MSDVIVFLALIAVALVIGVRLGFRAARAEQRMQSGVRDELVCIEADRGEFR